MISGKAIRFLTWILVVFVTACTQAPQETQPAASRNGMNTHQPTTLIFWYAWPSPDQHILVSLIDQYNQTHPQVQIVPQAMPLASLVREIQTAAEAGGGPHLILMHNHVIGDLAYNGSIRPLDDIITTDNLEHLLAPAVAGAYVTDNQATHLYGVPITFDTLVLYYNTAACGPTPPTDIERVSEQPLTMSEQENPPPWRFAYTLSLDKTVGYLYAFDGYIFDADGNVVLGTEGRDGVRHWLEWLLDIHHHPHILAVSDDITVNSALQSQKACMTIDWSHRLSTYRAIWGANLGIAPLPSVRATGRLPQPYVQSNVMSINARVVEHHEQQAALNFMQYLISEEAQHTLFEAGKQPVLLTLDMSNPTPEHQAGRVFRVQAQHGQAMPNSQGTNDILRDELERMQLTVLRGLQTPDAAITHTDVALRERIKNGTFKGFSIEIR